MLKFNNDNIFTGYIKQLLASFNLPKCRVYTEEQKKYHEDFVKTRKTREKKIAALTEDFNALLAAWTGLLEEHPDAKNEGSEFYGEYKYYYDSVKDAMDKLNAETGKTPELNVLESCFRNDTQEYSDYNFANKTLSGVAYPQFMRYIPYIKDGELQIYAPKLVDGQVVYSDNDWKSYHSEYGEEHRALHDSKADMFSRKGYAYNLKIRNYTKNLKIQNNVYDSYTHEYLGDFLRFHRDYLGINLMPLYNCFSNRVCPRLDLQFNIGRKTGQDPDDADSVIVTDEGYNAKFVTSDQNYKIYMIPVKLFKNYTIAMDSESAIEMCCGLFGQYQYEADYDVIAQSTYMCFSDMQFKKPMLYTKVNDLTALARLTDATELAQHEDDLKLFIKVPANNKSSIVVLEGDYTAYNDFTVDKNGKKTSNHSAINFEYGSKSLTNDLITPLQLLKFNTGISYPFADRLIEYLVGNVITPADSISDNVKRAKTVARKNTQRKVVELNDEDIWETPMRHIFYNYINSAYDVDGVNHDILGFVDKDLEKLYSHKSAKETSTIANVDIYDEWKD